MTPCKSVMRRMSRPAAFTIASVLAVSGPTACRDKSPSKQESAATVPVQPIAEPPSRPKLPDSVSSGLAQTASDLLDPMSKSPDKEEPPKRDMAQLFAEANIRVARCGALKTEDPVLRLAAQEASLAGTEMLRRDESVAMASKDGGAEILLGLACAATGHGFWAAKLIEAGNTHSGHLANEKVLRLVALNRYRAAQLMIPEAAKSHAPRSQITALHVDFDESFAASADHDRIRLRNVSGRTLNHCTVMVELRGKNNARQQNAHYVESWEPGGIRYAHYAIGLSTQEGVFARQTVYGVQQVMVSLCCDEGQVEDTYTYQGPERDQDVQRILQGQMHLDCSYTPTPLLSSKPVLAMQLSGVAEIPDHTVELVIHPAPGSKDMADRSLTWDQKRWQRGEIRRFRIDVPDPRSIGEIEMRIKFPGIGWAYSQTGTVPARR